VTETFTKHGVKRCHFTTCQTIQLHDLSKEQLYPIMDEALDNGIIFMGGGGDFPRNVMCSPLSGVEEDEYFDVMPYAKKASEYLLTLVKAEKMPRKLKVCFSNSKKNLPHATFRDLGFAANEKGLFDVYCCGGLGNNPRFGVKVAEDINPEDILYYVKAMRDMFLKHGNYENRAKARTRYMVEALGGEDNLRNTFNEFLKEALKSDLKISAEKTELSKTGDKEISGLFITPQKQKGLYAYMYHPKGGVPDINVMINLYDTIKDMDDVKLRLCPDESCYIINLTAEELEKVKAVLSDNATNLFETSVSCIGSATCQVGLRDSQSLLTKCINAVKEANINSLPQIHISGCPSSCGTHQIGKLGFRGHTKVVDKVPQVAFMFYAGGDDRQGNETMGKEVGVILENDIPVFLTELGKAVEESGLSFDEWYTIEKVEEIAKKYL
ncbi:MAG: nitrite/sulfite reductase, partial [Erysipelotrichaceae bacterium]|nr:nitrite/sulfite reductase [Erysipelotrichaceae bacterium]